MPEGESFWNPYRMVPVRPKIERKPPITDEKFQGRNGFISCELTNLTPIFIGGNRLAGHLFLTREDKPVIPGSSLKGMFRSLAELVGGGCNALDSKNNYSKTHQACENSRDLCIACRMFGMMERRGNARVHKGKVSVGDAICRDERPEKKTFQILLSSCGTRHAVFYENPSSGKFDGAARKLYFHQPLRTDSVRNVAENIRHRTWPVEALLPGCRFDFDIQFSNLEDDELALLLYVVSLEEQRTVEVGNERKKLTGPMRHKIGNAKPLGFGSCRIRIEKLVLQPEPKARFSTLGGRENTVFEGEHLLAEISGMTEKYVRDESETMTHLRKMMVWDETDDRDFHYPDYDWFQKTENKRKKLKNL